MAPPLLASLPVARRISALLGIVILTGLVLALMWRVYRHHEGIGAHDAPAIVMLRAAAA